MTNSTTNQRIAIGTRLGNLLAATTSDTVPDGEALDGVANLVALLDGYVRAQTYRTNCLAALATDGEIPAPDKHTPLGEHLAAIEQAFNSAAVLAEHALARPPLDTAA